MNRYDAPEPLGQLLLTVRPQSRLPNLIGLPLLGIALLLVFGIATAFALKHTPSAWLGPVILISVLLVYLAIITRDYVKQRSLAASGEVYRFDRLHNAVTYNGALLAVLDQIESVRVRIVDPLRTRSYALELVLRDSSEVSIPATNKAEIESLASLIGTYLGVRVNFDNLDY